MDMRGSAIQGSEGYSQLNQSGPFVSKNTFTALRLSYPNLFVHDADEEEPLAGGQSCPGLAGAEPIAVLQSLEALEALMSCEEQRGVKSFMSSFLSIHIYTYIH